MKILVTGAKGMIGSQLVIALLDKGYTVIGVDRIGQDCINGNYRYFNVDLGDKEKLKTIVNENGVDRFIHLAALAHRSKETDLSWEHYMHINVECSKNVFEIASDRPVLFISTVDVFGIYDGKFSVNGNTELHPVTNYGKSKALAEKECQKLAHYSIFRFSPVYTKTIKRDIQKRYYLKYPNIAYQIGKGTGFEILCIDNAVREMVEWCNCLPNNDIKILKDKELMWTPDYIAKEKREGRAKVVLYFPRWTVNVGYWVIRKLLGDTNRTYLLNKAVHPLRTEK